MRAAQGQQPGRAVFPGADGQPVEITRIAGGKQVRADRSAQDFPVHQDRADPVGAGKVRGDPQFPEF